MAVGIARRGHEIAAAMLPPLTSHELVEGPIDDVYLRTERGLARNPAFVISLAYSEAKRPVVPIHSGH
jgi:hypothetical protein